MKFSGPLSLAMLVAMTVACAVYMTVDVLKVDPRRSTDTVTMVLDSSGGLMNTSEVDLRGMRIGKVSSISATDQGLAVRMELDARYRVPVDSVVRVANLSAAGEQFVDFRPTGTAGPYLHDGSVIATGQVQVATTVSDALAKLDELNSQLNPDTITHLADTLAAGFAGRDADIANLTKALTLTAQMLHDKQDELTRLYLNLQHLGDHFDGYGPTIGATAPDVDAALPPLLGVIQGFRNYSYTGEHIWDDPLGPLVQKIGQYLALLGPDLGYLATVLKPATSVIKPLRVDAGSIIDLLDQAFPPGGPARVTVQLPK